MTQNGYRLREAWDGNDWVADDLTDAVIMGGEANWHPNLPPAVDSDNDGFSDNLVRGVYSDWAIFGRDDERTYGLSIIERPVQRLLTPADTWPAMPARPNASTYANDAAYPVFADMSEAKEYANYLKSQYIVMFGPFDITDIFFDYGIDTAQQPDDLVCFEDDVLDRREATFANIISKQKRNVHIGIYPHWGE